MAGFDVDGHGGHPDERQGRFGCVVQLQCDQACVALCRGKEVKEARRCRGPPADDARERQGLHGMSEVACKNLEMSDFWGLGGELAVESVLGSMFHQGRDVGSDPT
jgi:hypothetical protein